MFTSVNFWKRSSNETRYHEGVFYSYGVRHDLFFLGKLTGQVSPSVRETESSIFSERSGTDGDTFLKETCFTDAVVQQCEEMRMCSHRQTERLFPWICVLFSVKTWICVLFSVRTDGCKAVLSG